MAAPKYGIVQAKETHAMKSSALLPTNPHKNAQAIHVAME
jgi:hypothetical protein